MIRVGREKWKVSETRPLSDISNDVIRNGQSLVCVCVCVCVCVYIYIYIGTSPYSLQDFRPHNQLESP